MSEDTVEVERRSPLNWKFLEDDRPKRAINGSSVASKRSQIHEETAEFIDEHAFKKETNKLTNKKDKPWIVEMRLEDLLLVVNG